MTKTDTAAPCAASLPAAGIWVPTVAFGSGGGGSIWPSFSPALSSAAAACWTFIPTTDGTLTLPLPTTTWIVTRLPRLTFLPAAGVWAMIAPGLPVPGTLSTCGTGFRPAFVRSCSAANGVAALVRSGTVTVFGSRSSTTTAIAIRIGSSVSSQIGSHGRWR